MKMDKVRTFVLKTDEGVQVYKTNCPSIKLERIFLLAKSTVKDCEGDREFEDISKDEILKTCIFDEIENNGYDIDRIQALNFIMEEDN